MKIKFLEPKALAEIHTSVGTYLQHYDSIVAYIPSYGTDRTIELGEDFEYSRTTMKHLRHFLGCGIAETRKNIESGKWKLNPNLGEEL